MKISHYGLLAVLFLALPTLSWGSEVCSLEVGVEFQYGGLTTRARIYSKASIVCNGVDADVKAVNDFNAAQAKIDIGNRHKEPLRERITKLTTALEASGYQLLNCQMEESVYICFLRRD